MLVDNAKSVINIIQNLFIFSFASKINNIDLLVHQGKFEIINKRLCWQDSSIELVQLKFQFYFLPPAGF